MEWCLSTSFDWKLTQEVIGTIVQIVAVGVALAGLATWRRQIVGKTSHEVALRVLVAAYRVRDEIRSLRSWVKVRLVAPDVAVERGVLGKPTQEMLDWRNQANDRIEARVVELQIAALDAEASWGFPARAQILQFKSHADRFRRALDRYCMWLEFPQREDADKQARESWELLAAPGELDKPDPYGEGLRNSVKMLETFYRAKAALT